MCCYMKLVTNLMQLELFVFVLNLFSSVQSFSCVHLFATPWPAASQASLSITKSWSMLKLISIKLEMPTNNLILCLPLFLLSSIFPYIRVFSNESVLPNRWANNWSFNLNISPSSEYSGLISFRMHWFYLLAVQGTLTSLLQGEGLILHKNRNRPLSPPQIYQKFI